MTPEVPVVVAPVPPEAAEAEAVLEETAVTLDAIGEAIEEQSIASNARGEEILTEVRECRSTVNQLLSQLPTLQTESPSMQQALIQLTALQAAVEKIQSEVEQLRESNRSRSEGADGPPRTITPSEKTNDGQNNEQSESSSRPESNQSPTPPTKRKRYVKI